MEYQHPSRLIPSTHRFLLLPFGKKTKTAPGATPNSPDYTQHTGSGCGDFVYEAALFPSAAPPPFPYPGVPRTEAAAKPLFPTA
jgi:hypothetical protein